MLKVSGNLTLGFSSGRDVAVVGSSPMLGSTLGMESASGSHVLSLKYFKRSKDSNNGEGHRISCATPFEDPKTGHLNKPQLSRAIMGTKMGFHLWSVNRIITGKF